MNRQYEVEIFQDHWVDVDPEDLFDDEENTINSYGEIDEEIINNSYWWLNNFIEPPKRVRIKNTIKPTVNLLTVSEVAKKTGLTPSRIRQLAPKIPGAIKKAAGWLIPEEALNVQPLASRPKPGPKPKQK